MRNNNGKYLKKKARLPLSVYLSYLLALTLVLSGVTMSKYTSTASGTSTARVAKFDVKVIQENTWASTSAVRYGRYGEISYITDPVSCKFYVKNDSEVNVSYRIVIELGEKTNEVARLKFGDQTITGNKFTSQAYTLNAGDKSQTYTITLSALENEEAMKAEKSYVTNMRVYVEAVQID